MPIVVWYQHPGSTVTDRAVYETGVLAVRVDPASDLCVMDANNRVIATFAPGVAVRTEVAEYTGTAPDKTPADEASPREPAPLFNPDADKIGETLGTAVRAVARAFTSGDATDMAAAQRALADLRQ